MVETKFKTSFTDSILKMYKTLSKIAGIGGYIIQYGCITHCTFEYLGDFVVCVGPSMEPTLHTNNVLITDRISPRLKNLQRGDIVITRSPTNPQQHVCKRIVGMPGDRIMTKASFNLNPLSNTYTIHSTIVSTSLTKPPAFEQKLRQKWDAVSGSVDTATKSAKERLPTASVAEEHQQPEIRISIVTVPRGHLWIEGDNVHNSSDSRNYGPVPIGLVKSRALCRVWPLTEVELFV
ncbi:mitochondrial inner membrane protease subunit 1 [Topomyia yanbarensis]|uniref:mitochondrial inner membrane protease subunit 1 n=1 Tax=Topomyia yanbarensis TaxID=2498891 RepID=UPI00273CB11D|nr:mitochondrial inner membrane protease subunit 1 [Topomyia yanbarensis]